MHVELDFFWSFILQTYKTGNSGAYAGGGALGARAPPPPPAEKAAYAPVTLFKLPDFPRLRSFKTSCSFFFFFEITGMAASPAALSQGKTGTRTSQPHAQHIQHGGSSWVWSKKNIFKFFSAFFATFFCRLDAKCVYTFKNFGTQPVFTKYTWLETTFRQRFDV